jgi:hypothetical protein
MQSPVFAEAFEDAHGHQRRAEEIECLVMDEFPHLQRSDMVELGASSMTTCARGGSEGLRRLRRDCRER